MPKTMPKNMSDPTPKSAWYVLHTRSHFENVVFTSLSGKELETFLPKMRVKSRRKDRQKMIDVPVFPGYVFVRSALLPAEHVDILKTVGAVRLIGNSAGPVPVPDDTVESLRIMTEAQGAESRWLRRRGARKRRCPSREHHPRQRRAARRGRQCPRAHPG